MYAESLGVSEYFNKPVKMDKLITTAERFAGRALRRRWPSSERWLSRWGRSPFGRWGWIG